MNVNLNETDEKIQRIQENSYWEINCLVNFLKIQFSGVIKLCVQRFCG